MLSLLTRNAGILGNSLRPHALAGKGEEAARMRQAEAPTTRPAPMPTASWTLRLRGGGAQGECSPAGPSGRELPPAGAGTTAQTPRARAEQISRTRPSWGFQGMDGQHARQADSTLPVSSARAPGTEATERPCQPQGKLHPLRPACSDHGVTGQWGKAPHPASRLTVQGCGLAPKQGKES